MENNNLTIYLAATTMSEQPIDTNCMTLTRFVLAEQRRFGGSGDLSQLLTSIQSAVKAISAAVRRAGIAKLFGAAGETNVQGEQVRHIVPPFGVAGADMKHTNWYFLITCADRQKNYWQF